MRIEKLKVQLEAKKRRLDLYLAAEETILSGAQSYTIGSRTLTRADIDAIRKVISGLENEIASMEAELNGAGRRRCMRALPRDI